MPQLRKAFESIGLGHKEIGVLEVLLQGGLMYAAAVAKGAKLNRTTTYGILKELSGKGLVSSTKQQGVLRYQSIAPELLPGYIERRGKELLDMKTEVAEMVPQLQLMRSKGSVLPKVQFFEGAEGMQQAYEDTLEGNREKKIRDITGIDAVVNNLDQKFVTYYLEKRARLGIECTDVVPETELSKKSKDDDKKYLRETRFIPSKFNFDGEISIYDNKVGIFSYAPKAPAAIIIEDKTIAHMMKQLFDYLATTAKA
ncbi:hypothetical protein A3C18_03100 [Candidatus Kaiserbacteria bacterium RIFCSPHIGHO2_02_FULL_54_11b]|uniref:Transcription regulator TrmB N-terminal domain-containing protein n=2 Tax=Candidatus Kaiseribacteriota TaxID=1752734 RepID=A0A1F6CQS2_9BACT|nr:MAG: hypothetical protein A2704_04795 [Candidatus Kaiserbacteria bacterium RIFCSPHIGHO2_01_FULL_54_36b]OGG63939.1 MAG: hypothetical protein A3C18_03100 [Candidatus Kaiserbacteria bacterium RIFCSPHIGHO2_02_FULL_54_11b]